MPSKRKRVALAMIAGPEQKQNQDQGLSDELRRAAPFHKTVVITDWAWREQLIRHVSARGRRNSFSLETPL
jgi:hypothetical protein